METHHYMENMSWNHQLNSIICVYLRNFGPSSLKRLSHQALVAQLTAQLPSPAHFSSSLHFAKASLTPCKLALPKPLARTSIWKNAIIPPYESTINKLIQSIVFKKLIQSIVFNKLSRRIRVVMY